jgi:hypothetical protein
MELKRKKLKDAKKTQKEADAASRKGPSEFQDLDELKKSVSAGEESDPRFDPEGYEAKGDGQQSDKSSKRSRLKKILPAVAAASIIVIAAGFAYRYKNSILPSDKGPPKPEQVTSLLRPVPQPDYREMLDFLLAYELDGQTMMTALRMQVAFQSPARYQNFKEQTVAFRDIIYTFLLKQNMSGNSVKTWHSVVENDLLNYMMVRLPQSYPDKVLLTQVENL